MENNITNNNTKDKKYKVEIDLNKFNKENKTNFKLPFFVFDVLNTLENNKYQAFLVGGCTRDYLLNKHIHDYDIATNAKPDEVTKLFENKYKVVPTGLQHGTVTVVNKETKFQIEITTFRKESIYEDNRHPKDVEFLSDYHEDSTRRDFTMNAIYYSLHQKMFLDPQNGIDDLKNKTIKAIGNPDIRFQEDALRILRAIRFYACMDGFTIDKETKEAIFRNKDLLKNIAYERIREEFNKILLCNKFRKVVLEYFDIFTIFIPELIKTKDFDQDSKVHKYDCLNHLLKAVDYGQTNLAVRLALLFHDISKPVVSQIHPRTKRKFYPHHEKVSARIAETVLRRLKYDLKMINKVTTLVSYHDNTIKLNKPNSYLSIISKVSRYNVNDLIEVKRGDALAHDDDLSKNKHFDELKESMNAFIDKAPALSMRELDFNGKDLIKLGLIPNSIFRILLQDVYQKVNTGVLKNNKEEIVKYVSSLVGKYGQQPLEDAVNKVILQSEKEETNADNIDVNEEGNVEEIDSTQEAIDMLDKLEI